MAIQASGDVRGYHELYVELHGLGGSRYRVIMTCGDEALPPDEFTVAVGPESVEQALATVSTATEQRAVRKGRLEAVDPLTELGAAMYGALFKGPREAFLRRSQDKASYTGQGLRLLLAMANAEATALPWEFLHDGRDFMALSTRFPVVRRWSDPEQKMLPSPEPRSLRILAAIADIEPMAGLWTEMTHAVYTDLAQQPGLEVEFLDRATPASLRDALERARYDVLHLCGHASKVAPDVQAMNLIDEKGQPLPVAPQQMADILAGRDLKLVCLDACTSNLLARDLARLGQVPAIYGIQSLISNESADYFVRGFLGALLSGETLCAALIGGRQAIDTRRPGSREWGLPVLYTASPDGQLALGAWQTWPDASSTEAYRSAKAGSPKAARAPVPQETSRERQKLQTLIIVKRMNLETLEAQLVGSNYPSAEVQAQVTGLREEIATLEAQLG